MASVHSPRERSFVRDHIGSIIFLSAIVLAILGWAFGNLMWMAVGFAAPIALAAILLIIMVISDEITRFDHGSTQDANGNLQLWDPK